MHQCHAAHGYVRSLCVGFCGSCFVVQHRYKYDQGLHFSTDLLYADSGLRRNGNLSGPLLNHFRPSDLLAHQYRLDHFVHSEQLLYGHTVDIQAVGLHRILWTA